MWGGVDGKPPTGKETPFTSRYRSKFLNDFKEQKQQDEIEKLQQEEKKGKLLNKRNNYAKLVMETHKPRISKKKALEMQLIREGYTNKTRRQIASSQ